MSDLTVIFSERERELIELTERGLLNKIQDNPPIWDVFSSVFQCITDPILVSEGSIILT